MNKREWLKDFYTTYGDYSEFEMVNKLSDAKVEELYALLAVA